MSDRKSYLDPLLPWGGPHPYRVLARFGLNPESTSSEVLDAAYEMTPEQSSNPVINDAWEALRITNARLVVDFFCLDLPDAPDAEPGSMRRCRIPYEFLCALSCDMPDVLFPGLRVTLPDTLRGTVSPWETLTADPWASKAQS